MTKLFGLKLRILRATKGVEQVEFAKAVGICLPTASRWENGHCKPSIDKLEKVCSYYEVSLNYFAAKTPAMERVCNGCQ